MYISALWYSRPMPLGLVTEKVKKFIQGLRDIHPVLFNDLVMSGKTKMEHIGSNLTEVDSIISRANYHRKDFKNGWYWNLNERGEFTPKTIAELGFSCSFFPSVAGSKWKYLKPEKPDGFQLRFSRLGIPDNTTPAMVLITLPEDGQGELHEPEMIRRLLDWTIHFWRPTTAYVIEQDFLDAYQPGVNWRHLHAAWMTYVDFPPLNKCLPPALPCPYEETPDGGWLFTLTPEPPDKDNPEHLKKARDLQAIFESLYLCESLYVLSGWPHDAAELEYKKQITGAPEDRKYVVKMALFDGYDAERKVLLYAVLAREMSLYSADYDDPVKFKQESATLQKNDLVIEAHRQIAAVKMAGGDTPIEWHVGIEKNAKILDSLFKAVGIDQSRLRVRYTPFMGELGDANLHDSR